MPVSLPNPRIQMQRHLWAALLEHLADVKTEDLIEARKIIRKGILNMGIDRRTIQHQETDVEKQFRIESSASKALLDVFVRFGADKISEHEIITMYEYVIEKKIELTKEKLDELDGLYMKYKFGI